MADPSSFPRASLQGSQPIGIYVRYALFTVLVLGVNLGTQAAVYNYVPEPLMLSIIAGTGVGFVMKYFLDKHLIFFDGYHGASQEARKVILYLGFSVAMTLVFWGFEILFLVIGKTQTAKYTGAVIGFAVGSFAKYLLDRTYTFKNKAASWN